MRFNVQSECVSIYVSVSTSSFFLTFSLLFLGKIGLPRASSSQSISSFGVFFGIYSKKIRPKVSIDDPVKRIMGSGSSICANIGDRAENDRAKVLHSPSAVAANSVGNNIVVDR